MEELFFVNFFSKSQVHNAEFLSKSVLYNEDVCVYVNSDPLIFRGKNGLVKGCPSQELFVFLD